MSDATPIVLATVRREAELLAIARQLNADELELLIRFAREILARRAEHGPLHVTGDVRDLRQQSIEAIGRLLRERADALHAVAKLASAVLIGLAGQPTEPQRSTRRARTPRKVDHVNIKSEDDPCPP